MDTLIEKLVSVISDPLLITIILGFALTIGALWKVFGKQNDFIKERVDLLKEENRGLRARVSEFKEENDRLRQIVSEMSKILSGLQEQPLLSRRTTDSLTIVAEKTDRIVSFNEDMLELLKIASSEMQDGIRIMNKFSIDYRMCFQEGVKAIISILRQKERTNDEIVLVLNDLIQFVEEGEDAKIEHLERIRNSASQLINPSRNWDL